MTKKEAIDLLNNLIGMIEDNHGSDYDSAIRMAINALKNQPEIIRCKNCEHYNSEIHQCGIQICSSIDEDDFCSKGEKR